MQFDSVNRKKEEKKQKSKKGQRQVNRLKNHYLLSKMD